MVIIVLAILVPRRLFGKPFRAIRVTARNIILISLRLSTIPFPVIIIFLIYLSELGVEIGLCIFSRERLGTYFAELTQKRVRIAGVKRDSSGNW
jgi:hypothetical protein